MRLNNCVWESGSCSTTRAQVMRDIRQASIRAALLVGSEPCDGVWKELCQDLGIVLFWPDDGPLPTSLRVQ